MDDEGSEPRPEGEEEDRDETALLKAAVHHTVHTISKDCEKHLEIQMDRRALAAVAELTFRTMGRFGRDLELFAKHARRTKIGPEDVKLLFRNNPTVCEHLDTMVEKLKKHKIHKAKLKKRERKQKEKEKGKEKANRSKEKLDKNPTPVKTTRKETAEEDVIFENDFDF